MEEDEITNASLDNIFDPSTIFNTAWARCDKEGACDVKYALFPWGAYWILDTDYENYSTVYTCENFLGIASNHGVWIVSRDKNPSEEILTKAKQAVIDKIGNTVFPTEQALAKTYQGDK